MPDVTIKYAGAIISELSANNTATLKCGNKRMKTDLEVKYVPTAKLIVVSAHEAVTSGFTGLAFTAGDPCTVDQNGLLTSLLVFGNLSRSSIASWTYIIPTVDDGRLTVSFSLTAVANLIKLKVNGVVVDYDSDAGKYIYTGSWLPSEIPDSMTVDITSVIYPPGPDPQSFTCQINEDATLMVDLPSRSLPAQSTMTASEVNTAVAQAAFDRLGDEDGNVMIAFNIAFADKDGDPLHPAQATAGILDYLPIASADNVYLVYFDCTEAELPTYEGELVYIDDCFVSGSTITWDPSAFDGIYALIGDVTES